MFESVSPTICTYIHIWMSRGTFEVSHIVLSRMNWGPSRFFWTICTYTYIIHEWVMAHIWISHGARTNICMNLSHMNRSLWACPQIHMCHVWMGHGKHMQESWHIWMRHSTDERDMEHVNESWHVWFNEWWHIWCEVTACVSPFICIYERVMSHVRKSHGTYGMSQVWQSHGTYGWVMARINKSCHIWMRYTTYK